MNHVLQELESPGHGQDKRGLGGDGKPRGLWVNLALAKINLRLAKVKLAVATLNFVLAKLNLILEI